MKTGRPRVPIKREEFESLCGLQCTLEEIAGFFRCSEDTIQRWVADNYKDEDGNPLTFAVVFRQKRGIGKISLRRSQFRLAQKNATMAIFLGKQYLGQSDAGTGSTVETADDGFLQALTDRAAEDWSDGRDVPV